MTENILELNFYNKIDKKIKQYCENKNKNFVDKIINLLKIIPNDKFNINYVEINKIKTIYDLFQFIFQKFNIKYDNTIIHYSILHQQTDIDPSIDYEIFQLIENYILSPFKLYFNLTFDTDIIIRNEIYNLLINKCKYEIEQMEYNLELNQNIQQSFISLSTFKEINLSSDSIDDMCINVINNNKLNQIKLQKNIEILEKQIFEIKYQLFYIKLLLLILEKNYINSLI